jgi:hypothetical protein
LVAGGNCFISSERQVTALHSSTAFQVFGLTRVNASTWQMGKTSACSYFESMMGGVAPYADMLLASRNLRFCSWAKEVNWRA